MEINEHGVFWWADESPEKGVIGGHLSIDSSGTISLELNQTLPGRSGGDAVFGGQMLPTGKAIAGLLKKSQQHVLLKGLHTNGGRVMRGAFEDFVARECFVSSEPLEIEHFYKLRISLDGLQEWAKPGSVTSNHSPLTETSKADVISFNVDLKADSTWELETGRVELLNGHTVRTKGLPSSNYSTSIDLLSCLVYTPNSPATSGELLGWFHAVQDLLTLLANCTLTLEWPRLQWQKGQRIFGATYYFARNTPAGQAVRWDRTLLPFGKIKNAFGSMLDTWMNQRKAFGPGIHLYLGTRRNRPLYIEHQFVNLIWGLEALERRVDASGRDDPKLQEKIDRLKQFVTEAEYDGIKSRDRKWLIDALTQRVIERPLGERLFAMLKPVAIGIEESALKKFTNECATHRNDISHFGGERQPGTYGAFIQQVAISSDALSKLYLLLILHLLGVAEKELHKIIYYYPNSFEFRGPFAAAGLIVEPDFLG